MSNQLVSFSEFLATQCLDLQGVSVMTEVVMRNHKRGANMQCERNVSTIPSNTCKSVFEAWRARQFEKLRETYTCFFHKYGFRDCSVGI